MPNIPLRNGGPKAHIAVIPADGIGKEVTPEGIKVIRAATAKRNRPIEFVEFDWGADKYLPRKSHSCGGVRNAPRRIRRHPLRRTRRPASSPTNTQPTSSSDCASNLTYVDARLGLLHDRLTPLADRTTKDINLIVFREIRRASMSALVASSRRGLKMNRRPGRRQFVQGRRTHHPPRL